MIILRRERKRQKKELCYIPAQLKNVKARDTIDGYIHFDVSNIESEHLYKVGTEVAKEVLYTVPDNITKAGDYVFVWSIFKNDAKNYNEGFDSSESRNFKDVEKEIEDLQKEVEILRWKLNEYESRV